MVGVLDRTGLVITGVGCRHHRGAEPRRLRLSWLPSSAEGFPQAPGDPSCDRGLDGRKQLRLGICEPRDGALKVDPEARRELSGRHGEDLAETGKERA